jgi:hypothetical protein
MIIKINAFEKILNSTVDEPTSNSFSNFINFNNSQSQFVLLQSPSNRPSITSFISNKQPSFNNETGYLTQINSSQQRPSNSNQNSNINYHFLRSSTNYSKINLTSSTNSNSQYASTNNDTIIPNSVSMLINSRAFTLNSNHNNYSGFTAVDPSYVTVNSSKAVGPVTHRNYLALNDRALTTLNANTLLKQNSGYSGALSSYNPYESMNYSNTHSEQPQQTLVANTNFYNTRSKSVSIQKNRGGGDFK